MRLVYISHPYTGKETANRKAAEEMDLPSVPF